MNITRYFFIAQSQTDDMVMATGREVVLRLDEAGTPDGVFAGPTITAHKEHKANELGYRNSKSELITLIQALLPEDDELICLGSKNEIVSHYKAANNSERDLMRVQKVISSAAPPLTFVEAVSPAERARIASLFCLEIENDDPIVEIIINDQCKVAAHVGDEIRGTMLDETNTLKTWTAPEGTSMAEGIRKCFPKQVVYSI